jgi:hypothetical protein
MKRRQIAFDNTGTRNCVGRCDQRALVGPPSLRKIGPCSGCRGKRVALMGLQDKLFLKPAGGAMSPIARKLAGTSRTSLGTCPTHLIPPQSVSALPFSLDGPLDSNQMAEYDDDDDNPRLPTSIVRG